MKPERRVMLGLVAGLLLVGCKDPSVSAPNVAVASGKVAAAPGQASAASMPTTPPVQTASADPLGSGSEDFPLYAGACVTTDPSDQTPDNLECVGYKDAPGHNFAPGPAPGKFDGEHKSGEDLFFHKQFGTNGRTCGTCHDPATGTISPEQVRARYAANPNDPLFRAIDSDDPTCEQSGKPCTYDLLLNRATIKVHFYATDLSDKICVLNEHAPDPNGLIAMAEGGGIPADLTPLAKALLCDPAPDVVLNRGVPTMFNTPALDPLLMLDGRELEVAHQAGSAVHSHFQPIEKPSGDDLEAIADFERSLFTSKDLSKLAQSGQEPDLPMPDSGNTDPDLYRSQLRGREFFISQKYDPNTPKRGLCTQCHGGPMLNTVQSFVRLTVAGAGLPKKGLGTIVYPGDRFTNVTVSQFNGATTRDRIDAQLPGRLTEAPTAPPGRFNPSIVFLVTQSDGVTVAISSADPGRALRTGLVDDFDNFRIPTLWGVSRTAPYFHDNSAQTLEDVVHHYAQFFAIIEFGQQNIVITPQDEADLVAFLKLL